MRTSIPNPNLPRVVAAVLAALFIVLVLVAVILVDDPEQVSVWRVVGLAFCWVMVLGRAFISVGSVTDRRITIAGVFAMVSTTVCEPPIAAALSEVIPGGHQGVNDLWHVLWVIALLVFFTVVRDLAGDDARPTHPVLWVGGAGVILTMLALSAPNLVAGTTFIDDPSWRFGAYFVVYASVPISLCLAALVVMLKDIRRDARIRHWRVLFGALTFSLVFVIGAVSCTLIAVGAVQMSRGTAGPALAAATTERVAGGFMLIFMIALFGGAIPTTLIRARQLRRQRRAPEQIALLAPMWRHCMGLQASYRLDLRPTDLHGFGPVERFEQMRSETVDAMVMIDAESPAGSLEPALLERVPPRERAATLHAIGLLTQTRLDGATERDVMKIAAQWSAAQELLAATTPA